MKKINLIAWAVVVLMLPVAIASAQGGGGGAGAGAGGAGAGAGTGSGTSVQAPTGAAGQGTQDQDQIRLQQQIQDPSTHDGTEPDQTRLQTQDRDRIQLYDSSATTGTGSMSREQMQYQGGDGTTTPGAGAMIQERTQYRLMIDPEHIQYRAGSAAQLRQMLQQREQELNQEASSTAPQDQNIIRNENRVRLAVHAFLAAEDLLGGIGPQVSQIAQQINASVGQAANAEAQAQSRGFLMRLFFGGDADAGNAIAGVVAQNQAHIQQLTQLLSQAGLTPEVQAQLQTQLQEMQQEQERLQRLADSEIGQWGIFSWRF